MVECAHPTRGEPPVGPAGGQEPARQPNSYGCFICGLSNPFGLKMVFYEDPERGQVRAEVCVPEAFRSYPGVVHGGIVATILDETSGRALMLHSGDINDFFVTAKLEVRYRCAAPTDTPLEAVGWVERYGSRARVRGELRLPADGTRAAPLVLAECSALVVRPQPEFLAGWDQEVPYWRVYSDEELSEHDA
jgi:acyl-coenzyme A thioesterase PaaI-like protein